MVSNAEVTKRIPVARLVTATAIEDTLAVARISVSSVAPEVPSEVICATRGIPVLNDASTTLAVSNALVTNRIPVARSDAASTIAAALALARISVLSVTGAILETASINEAMGISVPSEAGTILTKPEA